MPRYRTLIRRNDTSMRKNSTRTHPTYSVAQRKALVFQCHRLHYRHRNADPRRNHLLTRPKNIPMLRQWLLNSWKCFCFSQWLWGVQRHHALLRGTGVLIQCHVTPLRWNGAMIRPLGSVVLRRYAVVRRVYSCRSRVFPCILCNKTALPRQKMAIPWDDTTVLRNNTFIIRYNIPV